MANLKVKDYFQNGKRAFLRFREKGGKEREFPVHHRLEEMLDEYLERSGLKGEPDAPLFPPRLAKRGSFRASR